MDQVLTFHHRYISSFAQSAPSTQTSPYSSNTHVSSDEKFDAPGGQIVLLDLHPSQAGVQTCGCLEEEVLADISITEHTYRLVLVILLLLRVLELIRVAGSLHSMFLKTVHHCNDDS